MAFEQILNKIQKKDFNQTILSGIEDLILERLRMMRYATGKERTGLGDELKNLIHLRQLILGEPTEIKSTQKEEKRLSVEIFVDSVREKFKELPGGAISEEIIDLEVFEMLDAEQ